MGEIVNLRRARKARQRADDGKRADENRIAFGTPKALKALAKARSEADRRRLDGARLKSPDDDGDA